MREKTAEGWCARNGFDFVRQRWRRGRYSQCNPPNLEAENPLDESRVFQNTLGLLPARASNISEAKLNLRPI
jgi:hypothetical protein